MVVMGAKNMVIAASHDGILVADKHQSSYIKDCLSHISDTSKYEERRWGTIKTIDNDEDNGIKSVTKRIKVVAGKRTPESRHMNHPDDHRSLWNGQADLRGRGSGSDGRGNREHCRRKDLFHSGTRI